MDNNRKYFAVIWKIRNFNFSSNNFYYRTPTFFVHSMHQTKWILQLESNSTTYKDCVACYLRRQYEWCPVPLELDYELSFITSDGSIIQSVIFLKKAFKKDYYDISSALIEKREELFMHKKKLFISDDTLTIRCRMWKSQGSISESAKCSVETRIITESGIFVGEIEKFSSLGTNSKNMVTNKSPGRELLLSSIHLCVRDNGVLDIEINPYVNKRRTMYKFKIFVLDVLKNKVKSCKEEIYDREPFCIPLSFSRDHLIENKELFLPNDKLTLYCEVSFNLVNLPLRRLKWILDVVYDYDCEDILVAKTNATNTSAYSENLHTERTTLKDDLISLFTEGILCDTKLKTVTESFPAHTVVLSARSPVFRSMFSTDMREKANKCVDIEDIDANTVRQMLLFMYKDTLDNLDYQNAKSLYFAADKYNIFSLRHKCSDFLKQNLLHSNCCEVLLLADKHQDMDLKRCVQDCISEKYEAVLFSDEWKNLEENHSRLTTEILRNMYVKNRKT